MASQRPMVGTYGEISGFRHRWSTSILVSNATHSTWCVIGST
jgi:hypothetical protein